MLKTGFVQRKRIIGNREVMQCLANYSHVSVADGATVSDNCCNTKLLPRVKKANFCWICLCLQRINKPVCMEMREEAWREPPQPALSEVLRELLRYRALETPLLSQAAAEICC